MSYPNWERERHDAQEPPKETVFMEHVSNCCWKRADQDGRVYICSGCLCACDAVQVEA